MSWKDIELALKGPMQSVAGLEYCLFELEDSMLSFKYGTKLQTFRGVLIGTSFFVSVSWLNKHSAWLLLQDWFRNQLNVGSFVSCLGN